jgi:hypothetical protein
MSLIFRALVTGACLVIAGYIFGPAGVGLWLAVEIAFAIWAKLKRDEWRRKHVRIIKDQGRDVAMIDYRGFLRQISIDELRMKRNGIYDAEDLTLAKGGDIYANVPISEQIIPTHAQVEAAVRERAVNQFGRLCRQTALLARAYEQNGVAGYMREFERVQFDLIDSYIETQALIDFVPDKSDFPGYEEWVRLSNEQRAADAADGTQELEPHNENGYRRCVNEPQHHRDSSACQRYCMDRQTT